MREETKRWREKNQARQRTLHRRFDSTSRAWGKVESNPCITSQDKVDHQTQTTIPLLKIRMMRFKITKLEDQL